MPEYIVTLLVIKIKQNNINQNSLAIINLLLSCYAIMIMCLRLF